jgi:hypothetical protein
MEAEFVNEYIARLIANLHDAVSKNVLHEARVAILEKSLATLQGEHEKLSQELERIKKKTKPSDA